MSWNTFISVNAVGFAWLDCSWGGGGSGTQARVPSPNGSSGFSQKPLAESVSCCISGPLPGPLSLRDVLPEAWI